MFKSKQANLRMKLDADLYTAFKEKCNRVGKAYGKTCVLFLEEKIREFLEDRKHD